MALWLAGFAYLGYLTASVFTYLSVKTSPRGIKAESNPLIRMGFRCLGALPTLVLSNILVLSVVLHIGRSAAPLNPLSTPVCLCLIFAACWTWSMATNDFLAYRKILRRLKAGG